MYLQPHAPHCPQLLVIEFEILKAQMSLIQLWKAEEILVEIRACKPGGHWSNELADVQKPVVSS